MLALSTRSRFDTAALYAALDVKRREQGLSWNGVAKEMAGLTPSMLTYLATGPAHRLSARDGPDPMAWTLGRGLRSRALGMSS